MTVIINGTDNAVGNPAIQGGTGGTSAGLYYPAANTVAITTSGTNALTISSTQNATFANNVTITGTSTHTGNASFGNATFSGSVGIGTATPSTVFQISNGATPRISVIDTRSSVQTQLLSDNVAGYTGTTSNHPYIFVSNNSEKMRLDSSGNLVLGASSAGYVYNGSSFNVVNSILCLSKNTTAETNQIVFNNPNGQVGYVNTNGTSTAYSTSSDYRLKENITPITNALESVSKLNPVNYTWKVDGTNGQGFIAHELQEVCPQAVSGKKDAVDEKGNPKYQGVDASFLVGMLTKAIQELKAELDEANTKIAALQEKLGA